MNNVNSVGSSSVDGLGLAIELKLEGLLQSVKLDGIRLAERIKECAEMRDSVRALSEKLAASSKERR